MSNNKKRYYVAVRDLDKSDVDAVWTFQVESVSISGAAKQAEKLADGNKVVYAIREL